MWWRLGLGGGAVVGLGCLVELVGRGVEDTGPQGDSSLVWLVTTVTSTRIRFRILRGFKVCGCVSASARERERERECRWSWLTVVEGLFVVQPWDASLYKPASSLLQPSLHHVTSEYRLILVDCKFVFPPCARWYLPRCQWKCTSNYCIQIVSHCLYCTKNSGHPV